MSALAFSTLYGNDGIAFLIGDTSNSSLTRRKQAINDAYMELAGIKGYWRRNTHAYTSESNPAMATNDQNLSVPDDFDTPYRMYWREADRYQPVKILTDEQWLERSLVNSANSNDPRYARLVQLGITKTMELSWPIDANFISRVGTLTLEYWIDITRLSADDDVPILPENMHHYIFYFGAMLYAIGQGDNDLYVKTKVEAEKGRALIQKHDLTRTGRPGQLQPSGQYSIPRIAIHDYQR